MYNTPQGVQTGEVIQSMAAEAGSRCRSTRWNLAQRCDGAARRLCDDLGGWSGLLDTDSNAWSFLHTGRRAEPGGYSNLKGDNCWIAPAQ